MPDLQRAVRALLPEWNHLPQVKGLCSAETASGLYVEFSGTNNIRCVIGTFDIEDGIGYGRTAYEAFEEARARIIGNGRSRRDRVSAQVKLLENTYGEVPDDE